MDRACQVAGAGIPRNGFVVFVVLFVFFFSQAASQRSPAVAGERAGKIRHLLLQIIILLNTFLAVLAPPNTRLYNYYLKL